MFEPLDRVFDEITGEELMLRVVQVDGLDWSPEAGLFAWMERDGVYHATSNPEGLQEVEDD